MAISKQSSEHLLKNSFEMLIRESNDHSDKQVKTFLQNDYIGVQSVSQRNNSQDTHSRGDRSQSSIIGAQKHFLKSRF